MSLPENAPSPRLCHLIKWPDFDGYGFNLHAEKTKAGQYIGKVDEDSPAMLAGLREGDKIIEVNSVNISNENHRQVVERIKSIPNETKLLVVEEGADKWYRDRDIVIKNSLPNVVYFKTPVPRPAAGTCPMPSIIEQQTPQAQSPTSVVVLSPDSHSLSSSSIAEEEVANLKITEPPNEKPTENGSSVRVSSSMSNGVASSTTISSNNSSKAESISNSPRSSRSSVHDLHPAEETSSSHKSTGQTNENGLNLDMSVSQMRQLIAQRKKKDAKKDNIDLLKKYEIIQQM